MPKAGTADKKIHLRRHHNPILRPRSRHHTPKSQEGRFRKRPKEREPLLHQSTFTAPSLQRQPRTPIEPHQIPRHIRSPDPPTRDLPPRDEPLPSPRLRHSKRNSNVTQHATQTPHKMPLCHSNTTRSNSRDLKAISPPHHHAESESHDLRKRRDPTHVELPDSKA